MQVPSLFQEDPLAGETETHSSILAWRLLWTQQAAVHGVTKGQTHLNN